MSNFSIGLWMFFHATVCEREIKGNEIKERNYLVEG